ncbi:MAG: GNVR domain-containing protein [Steroidobacter sp.]
MQTHSSSAADADTPGFGEYFGIIKKRRRLLFTVGLPIAVLAALLAIGLPDIYRSSGLIEIEEDAQNLNTVVARNEEEAPYADQYVQSLSTIVLGSKSLKRLLTEHQLYDDQQAIDSALIKRARDDISVDIVTVPILDPETGREREIVSAFTVAYDNRDPQRAQQGAAWLVDAFLEQNRSDRQGYAANAAQFFGGEAERMRKQVAAMESKLADFKAKNAGRLPELTEVNLGAMDRTENELRGLEAQIQALRRERVFLASQLQQASSAAPETANLRQLEEEFRVKSASYDESHPDMISLRRQIDTLRRGGSAAGMSLSGQLQQQRSILSEARQRYSEDHPDVKRIMRNIESLETRIASGETADRSISADSPMSVQLQTQINATDTQLGALQVRTTELRAKLDDLESRMTTAPEVEREYQIVTRDLASARTKYEELLKRQMDAEVSEAAIAGGTADKFRVSSSPVTPEKPAKPQRIALFIIGLVLGLIASLTAIIMAQLFDQTVRGVRDIRDILDVTPLTAVPVIQSARRPRLGKRRSLQFATSAAIGLIVMSYAAVQFIT